MPLVTLLETADPGQAERLYWRAFTGKERCPAREPNGLIPVELARQMESEKFRAGVT